MLSVRKQNCCDYYANVSLSRRAKENDLCVKSYRITASVTEGGKLLQTTDLLKEYSVVLYDTLQFNRVL